MGSSQLRLSNNSHFCAIGDVKIHPSVAIAPGAVLEAAPGSRIEVAVGVCIGTGCVIQVQQGTLELAAGASLGGGVLIFGSGRVGANACIGSEATLLYPEVEDGAAIAAKSLIGDRSRQLAAAPEPETQSKPRLEPTVSAADKESVNGAVSPDEENPDTQKTELGTPETNGAGKLSQFSHVYGKDQVNQLLSTLFPQRQTLNQPASNQ